jgi:hypothetical protein
MSIFGQAYQEMTGGSLTGQAAIAAIMEAIPKGNVKSGEILPLVARIMRERAAPKLDVAMKTSQAQQARFQNTTADMAILASNSGLEAGFSRLFRALNDGLKEAGPMIESLARGFDDVTKGVASALLVVQSFQRFFQGRDSAIGDMLFPTEENREKAFIWIEATKNAFSAIGDLITMAADGWKMLFSMIDINYLLDALTNVSNRITNIAGAFVKIGKGDFSGAFEQLKAAGMSYIKTATAPGRAVVDSALGVITSTVNDVLNAIGPNNPYLPRVPTLTVSTPSGYDPASHIAKIKAQETRAKIGAMNNYELPVINMPLNGKPANSVDVRVMVDIKAANPEDFQEQFKTTFNKVIQDTMLQYSEKE